MLGKGSLSSLRPNDLSTQETISSLLAEKLIHVQDPRKRCNDQICDRKLVAHTGLLFSYIIYGGQKLF